MSKLLINEPPLQVLPTLAAEIGLNEAIVLQQLHYLIQNPRIKGYIKDGKKWIKNTYEEWRDRNFPFWSAKTVQRTFDNLEKYGLVSSMRPDAARYDQGKAYTIDYKTVDAMEDGTGQLVQIDDDNLTRSEQDNLSCSLNELKNKETIPETERRKPQTSIPVGSDISWMMLAGRVDEEQIAVLQEKERREAAVRDLWEREMGYNPLDWNKRDMTALLRFLLERPPEEIKRFAAWSNRPYSTFDPVKARLFPKQVIEYWKIAMAWKPGGEKAPSAAASSSPMPKFVEDDNE